MNRAQLAGIITGVLIVLTLALVTQGSITGHVVLDDLNWGQTHTAESPDLPNEQEHTPPTQDTTPPDTPEESVIESIWNGIQNLGRSRSNRRSEHATDVRTTLQARFSAVTNVTEANGRYTIHASQGRNAVFLRDVEDPDALTELRFTHGGRTLTTDVVHVDGTGTGGTVTLATTGPVHHIVRCTDFSNDKCVSGWERTNIPFTRGPGYVEFTVPHFSSYGGTSNAYTVYPTSSSDISQTPPPFGFALAPTQSVNVSETDDGTGNTVSNVHNTDCTDPQYMDEGLMKALFYPNATGRLSAGSTVAFNSSWTVGNKIVPFTEILSCGGSSAQLRLYANLYVNGTLVAGDYLYAYSTGAASVDASQTLTENIPFHHGDYISLRAGYYINEVLNGGGDASRSVSINIDDADTWMSFTIEDGVEVNASVPQANYSVGETVNVSGRYYWYNETPQALENVTVVFFNSSGDAVQSRNVTTNDSGYYSDTYDVPAGSIGGEWSLNVTGQYNSTWYSVVEVLFNVTEGGGASGPSIENVTNDTITSSSVNITWATDQDANSSIEYGTTQSLELGIGNSSATTTRDHGLHLIDLTENTLYWYNVTSCDASTNCVSDGPYNFTTESLVISSVLNDTITLSTVNITWSTNFDANSSVKYGTTQSLELGIGNSSVAFTQDHGLHLRTLDNTTTYFYNVTACDGTNCVTSGPHTFTTLDGLAPGIENVTNDTITRTSVNITWDSTESANSSIAYGTTEALELGVGNSSASFTQSHGLHLIDLADDTQYFYNVTSCDAASNCNTSGSYNFTTIADSTNPTVSPSAPAPDSGDADGNITFTYTVSDDTGVENCSVFLNDVNRGDDTSAPFTSFPVNNLAPGDYDWYVSCTDSSAANNVGSSATRTVTVLNSSGYEVPDLSGENMSDVTEFYVNISHGKINFTESLNFSGGMSLNDVVSIGPGWVWVNSQAAPKLNKAAKIILRSLPWQQEPVVLKDGVFCADCGSITYVANDLTFTVAGFSNYSASANSQLNISDDSDTTTVYASDLLNFTANYTNLTDDSPISGAGVFCEFSEDSAGSWSAWKNMTFDGSALFYLNTTISAVGTHTFNVSCDGSSEGFEPINLSDSFTVSDNPKIWNGSYGDTESDGNYTTELLASADWFYGALSDEPRNFTVSGAGGGSAPSITSVESLSSQTPTANASRNVSITFTASDSDGSGTLNDASASAVFSKDATSRSDVGCAVTWSDASSKNYTCNVTIEYYDVAGVWSVNVSVEDGSAQYVENTASSFTMNPLKAVDVPVSSFAFGSLTPGVLSDAQDNPLVIDNIGNTELTSLNITAFDVVSGSYFIPASAFSVNVSDAVGTSLSNASPVEVPDVGLVVDTASSETNQSLYFYVTPPSVPQLVFSSLSDWIVSIG